MGLFKKKQRPANPALPTDDEVVDAAEALFDDKFREDLRQVGREHFRQLIDKQSDQLSQEMDSIIQQMTVDLREYLQKQLDVTISRINKDITDQLNERVNDYARVSGEAQELVTQSLSRNAQMVYEKYQQMTSNLQQIVASQEVMMVTVFQDNKANVSSAQAEQAKVLESIRQSATIARQQAEQLSQILRQNASSQAVKLGEIYRDSIDSAQQTHASQAEMLVVLQQNIDALSDQYQKLGELLDRSIADQKAMMAEAVDENLARIVEHYLMNALGEQSSLKAELPAILARLEANKQSMKEDMQL